MDLLDQQKRALRELMRSRLPAQGCAGQLAASAAAQDRLLDSELIRAARVVALYRALPSECGTAALAAALQARGLEPCYPVIQPGARALAFRRGGAFVPGALGIEEPTGAPVPLSAIDLLVLPAIAVDERGGRLGRGKGHYDATLAICPALSVALVFEVQLVPQVPVGEHDRRVAGVCTEARFIRT